ncbi:hypothetical protein Trydic_g7046 [Trypoxylus dichotomus]
MELDTLLNTIETTAHSGQVLSTEEGIVLYNSLLLLQNENHFRKIYFWGRICGIEKDYFIAYGYVKDALLGRIFYYSTNVIDWGLLPQPTEQGKLLTPLCITKFQGDPALVTDILLEKDEIATGEVLHAPQIRRLKEEDRLSCTVHLINEEAVIVPRGALFKRPDGVVVENLSFQGLERLEANEIKSYLHYRSPRAKWNTNLLTRSDYNYALDFLDPIDMDVPEGCWIIQLSAGGILTILKSLYWPGLVFYHKIDTPKYGYVYFGSGKKCLDIPFMLQIFG